MLHGIVQFGPAIVRKSGAWHRAPEVQAFSIGNQFLISSRKFQQPFIGHFAVLIPPNRPSVAIGSHRAGRAATVQSSQLNNNEAVS
jgi:hypothetical protein